MVPLAEARRAERRRSTCPRPAFVLCLENHDQVANTLSGARLPALTSPGRLRAMTALTLLAPGTPMLFQGQEFGSLRPFLYFADHGGELAAAVRKGRGDFLRQFPSLATPEAQAQIADPAARETFARCKLDRSEARAATLALHRDLLALRRSEARSRSSAPTACTARCWATARWRCGFAATTARGDDDRLLLVNLGTDLELSPIPEPLLAPPAGQAWRPRVVQRSDRLRRRGRAGAGHRRELDPARANRRWCSRRRAAS